MAVRLPLRAVAGCGVKISDSQESIRHVVQAAGKASTTHATREWRHSDLEKEKGATRLLRIV